MTTVLVIDDDEPTRTALCEFLELAGYVARPAVDGVEAADSWRVAPPDLVVTDLEMPGRDGLSTIRLLQQEHPEIPIIACSGHYRASGSELLNEACRLGAIPLRKPVAVSELLVLVAAATQPHTDPA